MKNLETYQQTQLNVPDSLYLTLPQFTGSERVIEAAQEGANEAQSVLYQYGKTAGEAAFNMRHYIELHHR